MRKLALLFMLALLFPLISSAEINFVNHEGTDFDSGETLLATISGNFIDQPTRDNIFFYRGHVEIPVVSDIKKTGNNEFYIYALLTEKTKGNYSVAVENVRYMQGTQIVDEDIVKNFTVGEDTAAFSLEPGFLIVKDEENFQFEVQNLRSNQIRMDVSSSEGLETPESSLTLISGETKTINFNLNNPSTLEIITLSSGNTTYEIPVFVLDGTNQNSEESDPDMEFQPGSMSVSFSTDSEAKRIVYLRNTGIGSLEDVEFFISPSLEDYVVISPDSINSLDENETERIEITIFSDIEEVVIEGEVIALTENSSATLNIVLNFVKDYVPSEGEDQDGETIVTTCSDLEGNICQEGFECSGKSVNAKDGVCCLVQCVQQDSGSSTGKIIGWGLVVLALILLFWFFRKYKKVRPKIPFGLKK